MQLSSIRWARRIELLLQTALGGAVEDRIFANTTTLHAPHLLDVEVAQVLRRYVVTGALSPIRPQRALEDLADLPLTRYPHHVLSARIWEL